MTFVDATGTVTLSTIVNGLATADTTVPSDVSCDASSNISITDSIVWNTGSQPITSPNDCFFSTSIGGPTTITGATNVNPQFVDQANGNFHISSTSPAIEMAASAGRL